MGRKRSLIITGILFLATLRIAAQSGTSNFEFIENKGQWDDRIRFKGELPAGAFFLQKKGFTVVQHNATDLARFLDGFHGVSPEGSVSRKTGKKENNETVVDVTTHDKINTPRQGIIRSHAYQVVFEGANEQVEISPEKLTDSYNNYYIGNDPSKWASQVRIFQAVNYKNIYPGIDVRYYSEYGRLKYDFIVHPGADVRKIRMKYDGPDKLLTRKGELVVKTSVGDIRELPPYSYQFDPTTGRSEVKSSYRIINNNTVVFDVAPYQKSNTLIIDPTVIFCSYTGSTANQWGFTATPGPDGSLYSGGIVFGTGFPVSPGAYQTNFGGGPIIQSTGGVDIGIFKFTPNGNARSYATYLGGDGNEAPHSLICDAQGNLVVLARTYSSNWPGTKVGATGGCDIGLAKFNSLGTALIGALKIGSGADDGVNMKDEFTGGITIAGTYRFYGDDSRSEVILDPAGNIFVAAQTHSDKFPIIGTVFQGTYGGGTQDGVVLKIDPTCNNVIWSSFLGGSGIDGAFVIAADPTTSEIYVGGATTTPSAFPGLAATSYQTTYQGGVTDGFVAHISNDGSTLIRSSYMGTSGYDAVYGIKFDKVGIPYIMGVSEGTWPVLNVAYSNAGSKQFIAKLKKDFSGFTYSTVFGSGSVFPNISPVAFLVDRCENVYVSGWGGWLYPGANDYKMAGTAGMPVTPDAKKSVSDNRDFYFIVLKKDASALLYGTYFGQDGGTGEHVDGGTSRFDEQGVIYQAICANCDGANAFAITTPFPVTPNAYAKTNPTANSGGCNLAAVKINFNFAGVVSGPKVFINGSADSIGCVPATIEFRDTVLNAKSYIWNFGDGSPDQTTVTSTVTHTYNNIGFYQVRLIAIDSTTCNIRDTAFVHVTLRNDLASVAFNPVKLAPCDSLSYQFDNLSVAPAGKPFGLNSFIWDFGDGTRVVSGPNSIRHYYTAAGTYKVKLILNDTNYCNSPDSLAIDLRISPLVDAKFESPDAGCVPYDAVFNNVSDAGQQFFWDFGDGTTSTAVSPTHTFNNVGTYRVKLVAIDSATCNIIDSSEKVINVYVRPTAEFTFSPTTPVENTPTAFFNQSTGGVRYKWLFGDGDSSVRTNMDSVMHQYNASGSFNACLITFNQFDCTDTACHQVQAIVVPLLDVPNAFTPGRFGRNSVVKVEGFGIARMTWRIYNRWGQLVFESNSRQNGWDGTYKGQLQPMDVYAYTLDVEFTDGTKTRKTGDITLIR